MWEEKNYLCVLNLDEFWGNKKIEVEQTDMCLSQSNECVDQLLFVVYLSIKFKW